MHQLNQEYSPENVYIAKINTFNTFWYIPKNNSRRQLFRKSNNRILFIALPKTQSYYCILRKSNLINLNDIFKI